MIAAVAFLAVAQHQLWHVGGEEVEGTRNNYNGLVGLSLTYALPIVGM